MQIDRRTQWLRIAGAGSLVCLLGLAATAQNRAPKAPPAAATPAPAAAAVVSSAPIEVVDCRVRLIDSVTLAAGRVGILKFVEPQEGDTVTSRQQVAGLDDSIAKAQQDAAVKEAGNDIQIRFQKKATEVAEASYLKAIETNRRLPGTYTEIELRELKLAAEKALLQIEQAENDLVLAGLKRDEATAVLKTYRIEAPFDGIVTKVYKSRGEAVSDGQPIMDIVSTDRVRVEGYIPIKEAMTIKSGTYVQVRLDIPNVELDVEKITFEGRVVFVDVKVDPVTGDVRTWAEVVNKNNVLRDGLTAAMTILPGRQFIPPAAWRRGDVQRR